ncbi:MFS transporter [Oceanibacterium hippocampi]|uniref:Vacuole effluxer Atg22 like protein n=1 Tax=Oceanibacterium hippocampi TaxID=745714 RepID=A0A1Y5RG81_9PROT|nr:MFS transporter [Oceanibacterium hippocampi]SLN15880.1 Vacuole effluxer Atg22 like protein [Oceanibacterium hippocampi]
MLPDAGAGGASPLGRFSWAMFDWANQPYFTVVTTFIFVPYFTSTVVGDPVLGQAYWGYTQAAAGIIIALMSPVLGAIADAGGPRKPWIAAFVALCVLGSFALWWATPGMVVGEGLLTIMAMLVIGTIGVEFALVFNNAMLPGLVAPEKLGRLSGFGWGLGYIGGLIALFIVLLGFSLPDTPLFGLDKATHEHDRIVGPMSAIWFAIFIIPLFLFTPDVGRRGLTKAESVRQGLAALAGTLGRLGQYRNVVAYLIARMIYNDAILAVIGFSGVYAAGIFGWTSTSLGIFGIVVTVFAAVGAFVGGSLDDRLGSKPTILISVVGLSLATLGILSIGDGVVLFGIPAAMPAEGGAPFAAPAEWAFMVFAVIMGLFFGPAQAASRTMMARLAPPGMVTEFFGLYALSGKATAFLAPLTIGAVTAYAGAQRPGLAVVLVFFVIGGGLMLLVREERPGDAG